MPGRAQSKQRHDGTLTLQDLSPYIDRTRKKVRNHTGELEWDWGMVKLTLNAPAAQGVTGFLNGFGTVELDDIRIQSTA